MSFVFKITLELFSEKSNEERTSDGSRSTSETRAEHFASCAWEWLYSSLGWAPASAWCPGRCPGARILIVMSNAGSAQLSRAFLLPGVWGKQMVLVGEGSLFNVF